jgi:hypothetical protein
LLSEEAPVGDDVFFNCFNLKECLVMLGKAGKGKINSFLNGLFWNCFALETVCMPNIEFRRFSYETNGEISKREDRFSQEYTLFDNCFSLKELDLRYFSDDYEHLLPCHIKQSNPKLLRERGDTGYFASFFAFGRTPNFGDFPSAKRGYIERCCKEADEPFVYIKHTDVQEYGHMLTGSAKPCCDVRLVTFVPRYFRAHASFGAKVPSMCYRQPIHLNNSDFHTLIEADSFADSAEKLSRPLYDEFVLSDQRPVFRRFNDAYLQWFVTEDENNEDKPKNEILNKKVKRTNFVLHGG